MLKSPFEKKPLLNSGHLQANDMLILKTCNIEMVTAISIDAYIAALKDLYPVLGYRNAV